VLHHHPWFAVGAPLAHVQNDAPQPRDIIAARLSAAIEVVAV